jgi:hypothetical protein
MANPMAQRHYYHSTGYNVGAVESKGEYENE